jgi:hypothetical protein
MNSRPDNDLSDLFNERSLWEIYCNGPSFIRNTFNLLVVIAVFVLLSVYAVIDTQAARTHSVPGIEFRDLFLGWAGVGISLASTILGFLIAGFAVLFTVFRPETVVRLQQIKRSGQRLSELKLLFFAFVDVFVHYIAFLFWCTVVIVVGSRHGPVDYVARSLGACWPLLPDVLCHILFVLWGTWFVLLVLKLKSFVYNLYQSLMLGMADSLE